MSSINKYTVSATASCAVLAAYWLKTTDWRGIASEVCDSLSHEPVITSDLAKDAFTATEIVEANRTVGHTHADAAALRTSATNFARLMAAHLGSNLYIIGMSRSDQRKGLRGSRSWFWSKDTNAHACCDAPLDSDVEYICDVDYYIDMPTLLGSRAKPTLLYTVVPESATSNGEDDTTFHFSFDGSLKTLVAGSGQYSHHLWNYGHDSILATGRNWFGFPTSVTTYAIERKRVAKHRQLILLTPMKKFTYLNAFLAHYLLDTPHLQRFFPLWFANDCSMFIRFLVHRNGETCYTTARPDTFLSATIPAYVDDAVAAAARLGSANLQLPTTVSWLGKEDRAAAAVVTEFHRLTCVPLCKVFVVFPVMNAVRTYYYDTTDHDPERRAKLVGFMSPLVHGAFAPVAGKTSEERCVEGRINKFKREEPPGHAFRDQCMMDFVDEIMRGTSHLTPVCVETVAEKQCTMSQRLSLALAYVCGPFLRAILKCFNKAEAYPDIKDPRCISTYPDSVKLEMSQFALAMSEHLKQFAWYGPGKNPKEIAARVSEICQAVRDALNLSDFHRMDGTIMMVLRKLERFFMMRAFPFHRLEVDDLLKKNTDNVGKFPEGTTFKQGPSHGSGCPTTSVFQTLRAACCSYLAYRHATDPTTGAKYSKRGAFDALGIHLGDDGIDADLPLADHLWAAKRLGLILEAAEIPRGERGVNFLARYYSSNVWYGCTDSMCDVRRQLSKFHTTVRLPSNVTAEDKLVEKAMSYVATDGNTPVIGQLCKSAVGYQPNLEPKHGVGSWWGKFAASDQYPNGNADGWMDAEFDHLFPEFDRDHFNRWLATTRSLADLLKAPLCTEIAAPTPTVVDVIVDGDVLPAKEPSPETAPPVLEEDGELTPQDEKPEIKPKAAAKRRKQKKTGSDQARPAEQKPAAVKGKLRIKQVDPTPSH